VFLVSVPLALLLGVWWMVLARKSLAPVAEMSERARRITAENLEQRLPVVNSRDDSGTCGDVQ
jgi:nitrogen fixation/metabolism regulation signal transduction histidine kinase